MLLALLLLSCGDKVGLTPAGDTATDSGPSGLTLCPATFSYAPPSRDGELDGVGIAGSWNDWDPDALRLGSDGSSWTGQVDLAPGVYTYQVVEIADWTFGAYQGWVCDPSVTAVQCDSDYKDPWTTDWDLDCSTPTDGEPAVCNSVLVVPDCSLPSLQATAWSLDRDAGAAAATLAFTAGQAGSALQSATATLDGHLTDVVVDGDSLTVSLAGLAAGRHTLRVTAQDAAGAMTDEVYIPFWTDASAAQGTAFRDGTVYYAFVDRMADGDGNTSGEGASTTLTDYQGGDFQGLTNLLPYLDDLGVSVLWISNPQDNAEGAWEGACDQTATGYHAYWPDDPRSVEEHFGTEEDLRDLVASAHDRGMRVVMDWVGNHVHQDHPYVSEHPEWFGDVELCEDSLDGWSNWDRIPESCWFAEYLPDVDYSDPDALVAQVDDAMWWVKTFGLDGLRIDGAKHMPHAALYTLQGRIRAEIEHRDIGGDEEFWTVGETFDGVDRINDYVNDTELDGQFDFPLYYAVLGAFADESQDLDALYAAADSYQTSWETARSGAIMSSFLGNHDVVRFITYATEGYVDSCQSDGYHQAASPDHWQAHQKMKLAWAFLYTEPSLPLVYTGDELAMPGYTDPDNRHPLSWYAGDVSTISSVADLEGRLGEQQAGVLSTVQALAQARREHPAFYRGTTTAWWSDPYGAASVYARARVDSTTGDAVLVVINRSWDNEDLSNGLAWAGLPTGGTWTDVLSGERFTADGDTLSFSVDAYTARVLVAE